MRCRLAPVCPHPDLVFSPFDEDRGKREALQLRYLAHKPLAPASKAVNQVLNTLALDDELRVVQTREPTNPIVAVAERAHFGWILVDLQRLLFARIDNDGWNDPHLLPAACRAVYHADPVQKGPRR